MNTLRTQVASPVPAIAAGARSRALPALNTVLRCAAVLLLAVGASNAADIRLPDYQRHSLPNGATVLLMEKRDVPLVALDITVRGGSVADAAGKEGSAALLAELLQKGAGSRDAAAFAEAVDAVGGRLGVSVGRHALSVQGEFLAKDAGLMIELAADLLRRPKLDAAEFDKVRTRAIQSLQAAKDSGPDGLIARYGYAWLFQGHAYARPSSGDEASLAAITRDDLLAFQRDQLGGDRAIITVVGDFDATAMRAQIEAAFGDWPKAAAALPTVAAAPKQVGRRVLLVDKPGATQTYFWFGNVGSGFDDPARSAQDLVQTVFGGRFTSMLNSELRVKSGLTYGARAAIDRHVQPGAAAIASFTRTDATKQALDLALSVLDTLHAKGLDAAMLESGRNYDLGQFPPQLETAPQLAAQLSTLALYGLGDEEINGYAQRLKALDLAAVNAATSVFARSTDLAIVLIGDAKAIRDVAATYGPVTEMALADPRFAPAK